MSKKKKGGRFRWLAAFILGGLLMLLAVLLGLSWYLCAQLFRDAPMSPGILQVAPADRAAVMKKIQPVIMSVLQSGPGQIAELTLSEAEFNAAVAMISNLQQMAFVVGAGDISLPEGFAVKFAHGLVYCDYSHRVDFRTPYGSYLNFRIQWEPDIRDGRIDLKVNRCRIGALEVSPERARRIAMAWLSRNQEIAGEIQKIISDFYIDRDGIMMIRYFPYQLKVMLQEQVAGATRSGAGDAQ